MPSGFSETQIFNAVLDKLAEETVLTTTDEKAVARWLDRNYPLQRDVLMQRFPWNFATKRALLPEDTAKPSFEWRHQYQIPQDCLRVLPITTDGRRNSPPVPFVVEGSLIMTDMPAPLRTRYIKRETNVGIFTPIFIDLLVQVLAANFAYWLTGKASYGKQLLDIANVSYLEAARIDSLEGLPEEPYDDEIIMVR